MAIEAKESNQIASEFCYCPYSINSTCYGLKKLIDQFFQSEKNLFISQKIRDISWGMAGSFVLAGALLEEPIVVGLGGFSWLLASHLRGAHLKNKLKYQKIKVEMEQRNLVFFENMVF